MQFNALGYDTLHSSFPLTCDFEEACLFLFLLLFYYIVLPE